MNKFRIAVGIVGIISALGLVMSSNNMEDIFIGVFCLPLFGLYANRAYRMEYAEKEG